MKDYLKYSAWALIQQTLVLGLFMFLPISTFDKIIYSIVFFSFVCHTGNTLLAVLTLLLGGVFYPFFYLTDYYWQQVVICILLVVSHGIAGNYLKSKDIDMKVWRFK